MLSTPCGGARLPVHKAVLAAQSSVFAAMWASGMQEGGSSSVAEVVIADASPATLRALSA